MESEQKNSVISISEAAKMLGVHIETMRRWDREGKLKAVRIGGAGHRKYRVVDLEQILKPIG